MQEVVLVGPGDPVPESPGALLVCLEHEDARTAGASVAGVVVRLTEGTTDSWDAVLPPVLAVPVDLPWNHLLHLLNSATSPRESAGDLFSLANSLAALAGGAVTIEDPQRRVLAYSSLPDQPIDRARELGILGRQVPELTRNDEIYRAMQRGSGVVRIAADGDVLPRLAVAVRSGAELLGSIWVIETAPVPTATTTSLLDASRLAALHLLRARGGGGVDRRERGELLRALLDGRSAPVPAGARLGLAPRTPVAVLAFALPEHVSSDELDSDAVAQLVHLQCAAVRPRSTVLVQLTTAYALVPCADLSRQRLVDLATAVVARAREALQVELRGAVGASVPGLSELSRSRADADAVLRLLPARAVAAVEDVLPQVVLLDLQSHLDASPHLRLPAVEQMLAHDAEHATPYVASVLAYLTAHGEVPAAAEQINVHPNTFRYRLRRVRELFDLDLEDPDVRLIAWLQLRTRT